MFGRSYLADFHLSVSFYSIRFEDASLLFVIIRYKTNTAAHHIRINLDELPRSREHVIGIREMLLDVSAVLLHRGFSGVQRVGNHVGLGHEFGLGTLFYFSAQQVARVVELHDIDELHQHSGTDNDAKATADVFSEVGHEIPEQLLHDGI